MRGGVGAEALERRLAQLDAALEERYARIEELTQELAELTENQSQNSNNSHLPASSDGPGGGSRSGGPKRKKSKSKRKRGGQKGRRGAHRKLIAPELVDEFIDLFPPSCAGCAASLPDPVDPDALRYQQLDLRDHRPHLTEWRRHEVECPRCGTRTRATVSLRKRCEFSRCPTEKVARVSRPRSSITYYEAYVI